MFLADDGDSGVDLRATERVEWMRCRRSASDVLRNLLKTIENHDGEVEVV